MEVIYKTNAAGTEFYTAIITGAKGSLHWVNSQTLEAIGQSNLSVTSGANTRILRGTTLYKGKRVSIYWYYETDTGNVKFTLTTTGTKPTVLLQREETLV